MDLWRTVHSVLVTLSVMKGLLTVLSVRREQQTLNILHAVSLQLLFGGSLRLWEGSFEDCKFSVAVFPFGVFI